MKNKTETFHKKRRPSVTRLTEAEVKTQLKVFYFNLSIACWPLIQAGWRNLKKRGQLELFLKQHVGLTPFKQLLQQQAYESVIQLLKSLPPSYAFILIQHRDYALLESILSHLIPSSQDTPLSRDQKGLLETLIVTQPLCVGQRLLEKLEHYASTSPTRVEDIQRSIKAFSEPLGIHSDTCHKKPEGDRGLPFFAPSSLVSKEKVDPPANPQSLSC